jgi:hypothetical protein
MWHAPQWGAPFIAARGSGTKAARWRNHGQQNGGGGHSRDVVGMVWRRQPDSEADEWAPHGFTFF